LRRWLVAADSLKEEAPSSRTSSQVDQIIKIALTRKQGTGCWRGGLSVSNGLVPRYEHPST